MWVFENGQLVWVSDSLGFRRMGRFSALKLNMEGEGGSGEGSGGEGGEGGDKTPTTAELKAQLDAMNESMKKLEAKRDELLNENKSLKDKNKPFDGLDPEYVRNLVKQVENDEELKLITEGKHDEVIKRRTEKVEATYKAQMKSLQDKHDSMAESLAKANSQVQTLMIDGSIVTEFTGAGGLATATDDIVSRAKRVWKIEDGEAVPRDPKTGEILQGADGVMTKKEWIEKQRKEAPHLFPASTSDETPGNSNSKTTDLDAKISAARKAGDFDRVRELKKQRDEARKKRSQA